MGLKEEIINNLKRGMEPRHTAPYKLHEIAVPLILRQPGSSVLIQAPTGHGKTAAFTLPILQVSTRTWMEISHPCKHI